MKTFTLNRFKKAMHICKPLSKSRSNGKANESMSLCRCASRKPPNNENGQYQNYGRDIEKNKDVTPAWLSCCNRWSRRGFNKIWLPRSKFLNLCVPLLHLLGCSLYILVGIP